MKNSLKEETFTIEQYRRDNNKNPPHLISPEPTFLKNLEITRPRREAAKIFLVTTKTRREAAKFFGITRPRREAAGNFWAFSVQKQ